MSTCVDIYNFCLVRGTSFSLDVGLTAAWAEVVEDPADWQASLVFRERQDDNLVPYLVITADAEPVEDDPTATASVYYQFNLSASQTQALPEWDIVAYCNLAFVGAGAPATAAVSRLFNSQVSITD